MRDKQFILNEIRRIAIHNDGKPVGADRFRTETGIGLHEWRGVHWARWSDALSEAGFEPLEWTVGSTVEEILEILAKLVRQYGRYPTVNEILIEKRTNQAVPGPAALHGKLGAKAEAIHLAEIHNDEIAREAQGMTGKYGIKDEFIKARISNFFTVIKSYDDTDNFFKLSTEKDFIEVRSEEVRD